jgi:hypothetical protein
LKETLEELEEQRRQLYRQIAGVGDFRRGIISVNYRKCGKRNCACARRGHPGHGPQYLWNTTVARKSRAANVRLGPELEKVQQEIDNPPFRGTDEGTGGGEREDLPAAAGTRN